MSPKPSLGRVRRVGNPDPVWELFEDDYVEFYLPGGKVGVSLSDDGQHLVIHAPARTLGTRFTGRTMLVEVVE